MWVWFSFSSSLFQLALLNIYMPLQVWSASPTGIFICCTVPSEAVPFVYLASVCWSLQCLISILTQAGGGGLLFRSLTPSRCEEGLALLSPLCCSGSRLLCMERALRCARFQPSGAPQKRRTKSCACVFCLPRQSGSGSQKLDGRTLPGCGAASPFRGPSPSFCQCQSGAAPSALRVPIPSPRPSPGGCLRPVSHRDPPGGCRPSRITGSLWLETGGLFAMR